MEKGLDVLNKEEVGLLPMLLLVLVPVVIKALDAMR